MLVVAVIPFLAFSDLTCHLEDTGIGYTVSLDSKEIELGSTHTEIVYTFCIQKLYKMYTADIYKMYTKFWQTFLYILCTKLKELW